MSDLAASPKKINLPAAPGALAKALRNPLWLRVALLAGVVALLEIYGRLYADPAFMSPPSLIVKAFFDKIAPQPRILEALWYCVAQIAAAYARSVVFGAHSRSNAVPASATLPTLPTEPMVVTSVPLLFGKGGGIARATLVSMFL